MYHSATSTGEYDDSEVHFANIYSEDDRFDHDNQDKENLPKGKVKLSMNLLFGRNWVLVIYEDIINSCLL